MKCAWYFISDKAIAVRKNSCCNSCVRKAWCKSDIFHVFYIREHQVTGHCKWIANCFTELLMEQEVYLCLLCWGTATASFTIPIGRKAVTEQGSANRAALALEIPNLKLLLCSLHFLFWRGSSGSTSKELRSLQSPPACWVSFLASRAWSALLVLTAGGFSPALFLWWAPCPESFYSSPWLSLPLFSDFGIPQCLYCAAHLPWPWWCARMHRQAVCGFSALSSVSQTPFFSPFPVFLSLHCSLQCLSDHFIRVAPVIVRFKTCEDLFTLFLPSWAFQQTQWRNWHHHSLDFLCHLSPEKQQQQHVQGWGQLQLSGLWGVLSPHPGCCFGSSLQPMMDFKLLWPGLEPLPYLTQAEWVTDETWLLNVSSLGQGLSSL